VGVLKNESDIAAAETTSLRFWQEIKPVTLEIHLAKHGERSRQESRDGQSGQGLAASRLTNDSYTFPGLDF
jgi:hypothetical protein